MTKENMEKLTEEANVVMGDNVYLSEYPQYVQNIIDSSRPGKESFCFLLHLPKKIRVDKDHISVKSIALNTSFFCIINEYVIFLMDGICRVVDYDKCDSCTILKETKDILSA